jgi:hypothetical protein
MSIPEAQDTGGLAKPSTVLGRVKALQVQEYALAGVVPPEVPRQLVVPAAVVTKDTVGKYEKYAFN